MFPRDTDTRPRLTPSSIHFQADIIFTHVLIKVFTLILSEEIRALFLVLVIFKRRSLAIIFRSFDHKCESEKLSYRKKVLINFQKFISQERHIRISI